MIGVKGGNEHMSNNVGKLADLIMAAVHEDMQQPFPWGKQIPRDVGSFSALHDYCDANDYLLEYIPWGNLPECNCDWNRNLLKYHADECMTQSDEYRAAWDDWTDLANAVSAEVDGRLKQERENMKGITYGDPLRAPQTILAADGKTVLYRFDVQAVVYARTRERAQQEIEQANIYLSAARIADDEPAFPLGWDKHCPECGSDQWDFPDGNTNVAECVNRHQWEVNDGL